MSVIDCGTAICRHVIAFCHFHLDSKFKSSRMIGTGYGPIDILKLGDEEILRASPLKIRRADMRTSPGDAANLSPTASIAASQHRAALSHSRHWKKLRPGRAKQHNKMPWRPAIVAYPNGSI